MERTLILQTTQGETVTEAEVCCFARQLLKDLKSDSPKIKWTREKKCPVGYLRLNRHYRYQPYPAQYLPTSKMPRHLYELSNKR